MPDHSDAKSYAAAVYRWWVRYPPNVHQERLTSRAYTVAEAHARWPGRCRPELSTRERCGGSADGLAPAPGMPGGASVSNKR